MKSTVLVLRVCSKCTLIIIFFCIAIALRLKIAVKINWYCKIVLIFVLIFWIFFCRFLVKVKKDHLDLLQCHLVKTQEWNQHQVLILKIQFLVLIRWSQFLFLEHHSAIHLQLADPLMHLSALLLPQELYYLLIQHNVPKGVVFKYTWFITWSKWVLMLSFILILIKIFNDFNYLKLVVNLSKAAPDKWLIN